MKKNYILLLLLILLLLGVFLLSKRSGGEDVINQISKFSQEKEIKQSNYSAKENSERDVTIKATPIELSSLNKVIFQLALDTHSVPLEQDLKVASVLLDDNGKEYKPISWSGESGGHHLLGELTFPAISKDSKSVKLVIKNIAGLDRTFSWDIK